MATLLILKPYDPAIAGERTIYVSDTGFATGPTDAALPNTYFQRRIVTGLRVTQSLWSGGKIGGMSNITYGSIACDARDGGLDDWYGYDWSGRRIEVYWTREPSARSIADFDLLWTGRVDQILGGEDIELVLAPPGSLLDRPAGRGTWTTGELAGQRRPFLLGSAACLTPVMYDSTKYCCEIDSYGAYQGTGFYVHQGGVSYGLGSAQFMFAPNGSSDLADFTTWSAGGGTRQMIFAPHLGAVRFRVQPLRKIQMGATGYSGVEPPSVNGLPYNPSTWTEGHPDNVAANMAWGAAWSLGSIARFGTLAVHVAQTMAGLREGDIDMASIAAADAAADWSLSYFYDGSRDVTCGQVLDELAAAAGYYWGFDTAGRMICGRLSAPAAPDFTLTARDLLAAPRSLPVTPRLGRVRVGYRPRDSVSSSGDFSDAATASERAAFGRAYDYVERSDAAALAQVLAAETRTYDTRLSDTRFSYTRPDTTPLSIAAGQVADHMLSLHAPARRAFEVVVPLATAAARNIAIGKTAALSWPGMGLSVPRWMRVLQIDTDLRTETVTMILWG